MVRRSDGVRYVVVRTLVISEQIETDVGNLPYRRYDDHIPCQRHRHTIGLLRAVTFVPTERWNSLLFCRIDA